MAAAALATTHAFAFDEDNRRPSPSMDQSSSSSYFRGGATSTAAAALLIIMRPSAEFTRNSISTTTTTTVDPDGELDVFGAEKYFSGSMDGAEQALVTKPREKYNQRKSLSDDPAPPADEATMIPSGRTSSSSSGTTRASASDTSCGDSRDSLLPEPKKGSSGSPQKLPAAGKKFFSIFRCSCVNRSSSEKEITDHERSAPSYRRKTAAGCNIGETGRGMQRNAQRGTGADIVRTKKEYFKYCYDIAPLALATEGAVLVGDSGAVGEDQPFAEERNKARRRSTTDAFRSDRSSLQGKEALASCGLLRSLTASATFGGGGGVAWDSDVCSESSSDLFEIEHLIGAVGTRPFRMGANGASTATLRYEPSEASVEWSFTTSSAAANFSLASDGEYWSPNARRAEGETAAAAARVAGLCGSEKYFIEQYSADF